MFDRHDPWRRALDVWLNTPLIADDTWSYIAVSIVRALVIIMALLAVWRVTQAAAVMVPPPLTLGNLGYWLRFWLLLLLQRDRSLKLGALVFSVAFVLQILTGQDGSLSDLTWYLAIAYGSLFLVFFGIARWATRHRAPLEATPHV